MSPEDIQRLREQVNTELSISLARRGEIDDQIEALRTQRRQHDANIKTARDMLRFADLASSPAAVRPPNPSPALERSQAALATQEEFVAGEAGPTETTAP